MLLRNVSPRGDLDIPLVRRVVPAGEVFEVTADQARRLLEQSGNFEPADAEAGKYVPDAPEPPGPLVVDAPEAVLKDGKRWKPAEPDGLEVEPAAVDEGEAVPDDSLDEDHEGGDQL